MAETGEAFLHRVLTDIMRQAKKRAISKIPSATLKASLQDTIEFRPRKMTGILYLPQYWAVYYHDGRGSILAAAGKKLVYFKDPTRDPRISDGYPIRGIDIRRLSDSEFYDYLKRGMLVVRESVGPANGTHFFTEGMRTFTNGVRYRLRREFRDWVLGSLKEDGSLNVKDTAFVQLPKIVG